jgi:biopolymer transport protein ExbB
MISRASVRRLRALGLATVLGAASTGAAAAAPQSLEELLGNIVKEQEAAKQRNAEREKRFAEARDQQAALLEQARATLAAEQARADQLKATFSSNELSISERLQASESDTGELRDFDAVVRQLATDLKGMLDGSLVSAQKPERLPFVESLVEGEDKPTMDDLERLWQVVLEETIESGKVVQFQTNVISAQGKDERRAVTRLGVFSATSNGDFLRYAPEVHQLVEQARQPPGVYRRMAKAHEQSTEGMTTVAFDPTRGSMLAILSQEPTLWERIKQARLIGFITLGLGGLAIVIAIWRFFSLSAIARAVSRQQRSKEADTGNPLGRVIKAFTDNRNVDAETLERKLDEAIIRELPPIQRGLGALLVIAEAAPLLGLLGTVSGMVATFQALSMFGAGDAKVVAGGISEALVATIIGLCVAIPALVMHSFLKSRSDAIVQVLDEQAAGMVARLAEAHLHQRAAARAPAPAPHLAKN